MSLPLSALHKRAAERKAKRKAKAKRIRKPVEGWTTDGKALWVILPRVTLKGLRAKLKKELHAAIRARDGAVCISCGKAGLVQGETWHAGHLFGVGAFPALEFHPLNISSQGACCNTFKHGNHAAYSAAFIRRYDLATFQALDAIKGIPRKFTIADLLDLRAALAVSLDQYVARYFELTGWRVEEAAA